MGKQGFSSIAVILIIIAIFIVVGGFYLASEKLSQRVCSTDVKQCPNGSFVSRTLPFCNFKQCPQTDNDATTSTKVLTPNGGEKLTAGETYEITWACPAEAEADVVDVFLLNANTNTENSIATLVNCSSQSYSWQIDNNLIGENSFKIQLRQVAGSQPVIDESDDYFSIDNI